MATEQQIKVVRKFVNDAAGDTQIFENDEIELLIDEKDGDLNQVASDLWRIKAGRVSEWYLVNIDGAFMSRDQAFDHAIKMSEVYARQGGMTNVLLDTSPLIVVETPEF